MADKLYNKQRFFNKNQIQRKHIRQTEIETIITKCINIKLKKKKTSVQKDYIQFIKKKYNASNNCIISGQNRIINRTFLINRQILSRMLKKGNIPFFR